VFRVPPKRARPEPTSRRRGQSLAVHLALGIARVGARASVDRIRALISGKGVVAVAFGQRVVTGKAVYDVRSCIAGQVVALPAAVQVLDSGDRVVPSPVAVRVAEVAVTPL
jgi:hypothetical protein